MLYALRGPSRSSRTGCSAATSALGANSEIGLKLDAIWSERYSCGEMRGRGPPCAQRAVGRRPAAALRASFLAAACPGSAYGRPPRRAGVQPAGRSAGERAPRRRAHGGHRRVRGGRRLAAPQVRAGVAHAVGADARGGAAARGAARARRRGGRRTGAALLRPWLERAPSRPCAHPETDAAARSASGWRRRRSSARACARCKPRWRSWRRGGPRSSPTPRRATPAAATATRSRPSTAAQRLRRALQRPGLRSCKARAFGTAALLASTTDGMTECCCAPARRRA